MVWIRFRFVNGRVAPVWSPLGNDGSTFTITKEGVAIFRANGELFHHYSSDRIAAVTDYMELYTREPKLIPDPLDKTKTLEVFRWEKREAQFCTDGAGRLIPKELLT